jgi:hypothetical protein
MGRDNTSAHTEMEKTDVLAEHKEAALESQGEQTYSDDGVDLTLIRWMLSLTPTERLQTLQQTVQSLMRLRDGSSVA